MSMQIKTITRRVNDADEFDRAVNNALSEGWELSRRDVLLPNAQPSGSIYFHMMLFAELVKADDALSDAAMEAFGRACDAVAKAANRAAVSFEQAYEALNSQHQKLEPTPITWQQAVETLKGICSSREDCLTDVECPMYDFCHSIDPSDCPCDWPEVPHD